MAPANPEPLPAGPLPLEPLPGEALSGEHAAAEAAGAAADVWADAPASTELCQPPSEPVSRQELNAWRRGFTPQAEIWNGRLAMLGLSVGLSVLLLVRLANG
jgi:hypothetical protein